MTTPVAIIKTDPIWFKNIGILFRADRITEFFPNHIQTLEERMNAVVRLGVYASILLTVYRRNYLHVLWVPIIFLVTWVIYKSYKKESMGDIKVKSILKKREIKPTLNNPFMNTTMSDYTENPKKPAVKNYFQDTEEAEMTRQDIKDKFEYNLYRETEDAYERNNSDRQFYTMPNTTIPSDQETYLNFLYGEMNENCKTDNELCNPYEDIRGRPMIFPSQTDNPTVSRK